MTRDPASTSVGSIKKVPSSKGSTSRVPSRSISKDTEFSRSEESPESDEVSTGLPWLMYGCECLNCADLGWIYGPYVKLQRSPASNHAGYGYS